MIVDREGELAGPSPLRLIYRHWWTLDTILRLRREAAIRRTPEQYGPDGKPLTTTPPLPAPTDGSPADSSTAP